MRIFNTVVSFLLILANSGCINEPYDLSPLRLTSLQRVDATIVNSFQYRQKKLFIHSLASPSLNTSSKFLYQDDALTTIVRDSTATSYTLLKLIYSGTQIIGDSVFTVVGSLKTKQAHHTFGFDEAGLLINVRERTWTGDLVTDSEILMERTGGNVTKLEIATVTDGIRQLIKSLTLKYDDRKNAYPPDFVYFYTLPTSELYWMSANNPVAVIEDGENEKTTQFWYNKFDYPSNFKDSNGKVYGVAYTESK